ncbi:sodium/myo-inositol cotransporter-like [Littorina saxatilis]|uniref:Sodium/myo-inositol cotransporter n=1 Tax=Littorina saxatilis TaxID=31220 RepID=A0AAN9AVV4_9CAEN
MAARQYTRLSGADIGVLISYFVLVILIGVFAMWRSNRQTVSGYFLAGRSMWFLPIGASLFVSNIGTEHFIGLAGSGAAQGISVGAWEFNALLLLQLLGWVFVPVYIACGTYTMPEYLSKRFGGQRLRVYFAVLSLILYIFTKCSGDLYTGALFIQQSLNWDLYVSIVILVLLTAVLTITGGLTAVIYTDTLQAVLMVGGALYLMVKGFQEIGGFEGLLEKYPQAVPRNVSAIAVNETCHWPDRQAFRMLRDVDDDYMPWLGFLLGQTPGSIWYWCADQVIVQRALAAKSLSHAQGATLMAGFIKMLPLFIMVMPGMISRILYPDEVACTNPDYCMEVCQSRAGCSNIAYPRLVLGLMPDGARGLMMAVMIAALMSDLDSIFNSASTLFTMDIWRKFRRAASTTELMVVGRLFIVAMVGVSIAWVPVIKETNRGQVFIYIQEVTNYLAPPFAAVYLLAVLVPMVNEKGAFWSLMLALVTGVVRLIMAFVYKGEGYCGERGQEIPPFLARFHYMYFATFITAMTAVVAIVVSYFTARPDPKYLYKTTYWTRHDTEQPATELSIQRTESTSFYDDPDTKTNDGSNCAVDAKSITLSTIDVAEEPANGPAEGEKKHRFVDPAVYAGAGQKEESSFKSTCKELFFKFVCGVQRDQTIDDVSEELTAKEKHLKDLALLKQSPAERLVLGVGLCIILAIGVSMYVFWSVYKFDAAPFYPEGANSSLLLPGDENKTV